MLIRPGCHVKVSTKSTNSPPSFPFRHSRPLDTPPSWPLLLLHSRQPHLPTRATPCSRSAGVLGRPVRSVGPCARSARALGRPVRSVGPCARSARALGRPLLRLGHIAAVCTTAMCPSRFVPRPGPILQSFAGRAQAGARGGGRGPGWRGVAGAGRGGAGWRARAGVARGGGRGPGWRGQAGAGRGGAGWRAVSWLGLTPYLGTAVSLPA
jgi:hypothetical protein